MRKAVVTTLAVGMGMAGVTGCGGSTTTVVSSTPASYNNDNRHDNSPSAEAEDNDDDDDPECTAPSPSGGGGQHFSGSGSSSLGTITVSAPSTLRWTDTGGGTAHSFAIIATTSSYSHSIAVSSNQASGTSQASPGTYHDVQVIGDDSWTITISPG